MLYAAESLEAVAKAWMLNFAKTMPKPERMCSKVERSFADPEKLLKRVKAARTRQEASPQEEKT